MPDIEGVPYEATGGKIDQVTAQALAARHREAASAGVSAASAAIAPVQSQVTALSSRVDSQDAKTLSDAKAYTDTKVTGLATTVAMNAADALTLSNAKTYTDEQLADFDSFVGVPIFETLAEAQAWEAANPGKRALTLEPSTPDTTAPTPGILSVTTTHNSALLSASGASDDRAVTGYAFQVGAMGAWSAWQSSPEYTAAGLTVSTSYAFRHKVRDRAGNEAVGAAVTASTAAAPPLQPGDVMTSDAYTLYASGSAMSGKFTDATLGGTAAQYTMTGQWGGTGGLQTVDGTLKWTNGRHAFNLTGLPTRADKEVTVTLTALTTADDFSIRLRKTGTSGTMLGVKKDGSVVVLLQGPAGNIGGPGKPAGTVKAGSTVVFGVKGDTGYYIIDGARTDIPSLQGNTDGDLAFDGGLGTALDNLVVKAL